MGFETSCKADIKLVTFEETHVRIGIDKQRRINEVPSIHGLNSGRLTKVIQLIYVFSMTYFVGDISGCRRHLG